MREPSGQTAVGVVGCGYFARYHLQAWRALAAEGAVLAAVCDLDADVAQNAAREFGAVRWYTDAQAMLATERLDLVDVATRMDTHRRLVELALARHVPTVVQKPMAPTFAECSAMVAEADAGGIFFAVHENFRFQRPVQRLKEILESGEIGAVTWARIGLRTGIDVYRNQPYLRDEKHLIVLDLGIHLLDLARFLVGEVAHLTCETQRRNPSAAGEDTAAMLLRHDSGVVSVVECTYENRRSTGGDVLIEVEATAGGAELLAGGDLVVTTPGGRRLERVPRPTLEWAQPPFDFALEAVLATCRHMLLAVRSGRPADTNGHDNLKTLALVEAAYLSAATRTIVAPATVRPQ